jgi:hypothetical protein
MRTPGTHGIEWHNLTEWLTGLHTLEARLRHPRTRGYTALVSHWDELEDQPREFFAAADPSALRQVQTILAQGSGRRGSGRMHGRARLKNEVNNALAKLDGKVGPGRPKITPPDDLREFVLRALRAQAAIDELTGRKP